MTTTKQTENVYAEEDIYAILEERFGKEVREERPSGVPFPLQPLISSAAAMHAAYATYFVIFISLLFACDSCIFDNFFNLVPYSLDEAAMIDGAGPLQTFYHIAVKLSVSTVLIVFL